MFYGRTCEHCGEEREVSLLEWWPETREFQLTACCGEAWSEAVDELNDVVNGYEGRDGWRRFRAWFKDEAGVDIRAPFSDCGHIELDYGLTLGQVDLKTAKAFVRAHHRHAPRPPCSWRWGHGLYNGDELVAVAMVGRPVARAIDKDQVVEVNRVCTLDDPLRAQLYADACSKLYAAAVREAKRRGFVKVITYTLEDEDGASLRGAGFEVEARTKARGPKGWDTPARRRTPGGNVGRKLRWSKLTGAAA